MKTLHSLAIIALLVAGCDHTSVQPTESPELASYEGLLAIVMDTDRPVLAVHYVSDDQELQFNLDSAEAGTSIQVHRVLAGSYCVRTVTWPTTTFHADHLDAGNILCIDVEPGVLNYPGHMVFVDGEPSWSRSRFFARYVPRIQEYEALVREEYPGLAPWLVDRRRDGYTP
ncbi:MAG: hypothetical protein ACE37F_14405 [Nannocystaceae bacterium]|nr:hypothetical protein [bacterium]